ncbi:ribosome biogenesis GTPase Der [Buchnera aphidicola]|uniref:ribosome biogenesis GTPase Der n=1 Tax=Buchnera aphidicola TaxID=9 RepID=UPI0031B81911
MQFCVTLVGQTNVGKSTIFNRILNKQCSIVHHLSHCTRDRKYSKIKYKNFDIKLFDTAGITIDYLHQHDFLKKQIFSQTMLAVNESKLVILVINAEYGFCVEDELLLRMIQCQSKKIFLVINKIDKIQNDVYSFYEYNFFGVKDIFFVSKFQKEGFENLKKKVLYWIDKYYKKNLFLLKKSLICRSKINYSHLFQVAIVGRPNVGKSTLLNTLLKTNRVITCNSPGTTRDSISEEIIVLNKKYIFTDTAGIKTQNSDTIQYYSILETLKTISHINIVLLVFDAKQQINKQDIWILNTIIDSGKILLILFNKAENLSVVHQNKIKNYLYSKNSMMKFFYIHFISSIYKIGINRIFYLIYRINYDCNKLIKTAKLNKIMQYAVSKYPLQSFKRKNIKLKYVHIGGYFPPILVIHGSNVYYIPQNYKRYLVNFFQKQLNIKGMVLKIIFKNQMNPYA